MAKVYGFREVEEVRRLKRQSVADRDVKEVPFPENLRHMWKKQYFVNPIGTLPAAVAPDEPSSGECVLLEKDPNDKLARVIDYAGGGGGQPVTIEKVWNLTSKSFANIDDTTPAIPVFQDAFGTYWVLNTPVEVQIGIVENGSPILPYGSGLVRIYTNISNPTSEIVRAYLAMAHSNEQVSDGKEVIIAPNDHFGWIIIAAECEDPSNLQVGN